MKTEKMLQRSFKYVCLIVSFCQKYSVRVAEDTNFQISVCVIIVSCTYYLVKGILLQHIYRIYISSAELQGSHMVWKLLTKYCISKLIFKTLKKYLNMAKMYIRH